jgi:hypothetical protein
LDAPDLAHAHWLSFVCLLTGAINIRNHDMRPAACVTGDLISLSSCVAFVQLAYVLTLAYRWEREIMSPLHSHFLIVLREGGKAVDVATDQRASSRFIRVQRYPWALQENQQGRSRNPAIPCRCKQNPACAGEKPRRRIVRGEVHEQARWSKSRERAQILGTGSARPD